MMKIGSIFTSQEENQRVRFGGKKEGSVEKIQKLGVHQAGDVDGFWDFCSLVHAQFGPAACKEKQNVT